MDGGGTVSIFVMGIGYEKGLRVERFITRHLVMFLYRYG
jgi:hypothetical protein